MARLKLQAPWIQYYDKIEVLFECDPDVSIVFDEEDLDLKLYVADKEKAMALAMLLPTEKTWGGVTMTITVVPPNKEDVRLVMKPIIHALCRNPIVEDIITVSGVMTNDITYVVFIKEVVQYFNDDLGDVNGNCSTLYQEIAKDVFGEISGVFFCTSENENESDLKACWP